MKAAATRKREKQTTKPQGDTNKQSENEHKDDDAQCQSDLTASLTAVTGSASAQCLSLCWSKGRRSNASCIHYGNIHSA
ncbi:hypothetical protein E8E11_001080 [Didymella keratinophila]|nr:hypothetical protein E8E11_001080 [Didymella keratinophila]